MPRFIPEAPINLKKDDRDKRDKKFKNARKLLAEIPTDIPKSVDYTSEMSPIKQQGKLGSCVAFAVCALKEWQEQSEHAREVKEGKIDHRDKRFYDLSEQWIYYMAKKLDPWPNEEGTSIRYGMKVLEKIGVPVESGWEYNDEVKGDPESWAHLVARWNTIKTYRRLNSLKEIRLALTLSPVVIGVELFEEFMQVDRSGVVRWPAQSWKSYGGHALCVVGYDNDREEFKIKNSWGPGWGDSGYGYLSYRYMNEYLWDAWECDDYNVTKNMLKGSRELLSENS